jgi:hypothetical protein
MIFSAQQLFSNGQAVTVTAISENVIDTGVRGTPYGAKAALTGDIGKGVPIEFLVQVVTTFASLTSMVITLETSANADLSSSTVLYRSETILAAALVQGFNLPVRIIPDGAIKRYLGLRYTVVGTGTAGNIDAGITMGNQTNLVSP